MVVGHPWSVYRVRDVFFFYFEENKHAQLSSTPVIPVDDTKVPLIHACLNRFKGTLNGRGSKRTCFSMRCIIVGGDDAELIDHFNNDATYHRFTEVLGSWSFGDYFKEDAIRLLFDLLCQKYELPQHGIYASYFSADTSSGLSPDNESKSILQKYLAEERIRPSMSKADYWITGETGPCGPCLGIFFDRSASQDGVGSVMNKTDSKFIEICRLVFVEFNRQADGVLEPLQNKHVLTGINVECLAAILQNKETHYELDVYDDVLTHISCYARREAGFYSGKIGDADTLGVDTAYRLLADHIRMIAVTNAPGSQLGLGNEGRKYFLYCADKQAVQYGHLVLEADVEKLDQERHEIIIEGILQNEEDLCPEGYKKMGKIVEDEMMIYKNTMAELRDQELPFDMGGKKKKKKDATSVVWYATRVIEFLGRRTQIILKNKDTRCSLVPLCNALLLGEKITLSLDIKKVSESHLIFLVQSYLLSQMQLEQNLELSESNKQVLGVLPKLPGSLYFDVTFGSSCGFELTSETALFAFLGVPLHHGWLVDPQDVELGSAISKSSYTKLSYHLGVYDELIRPSENSGSQKHGGFKEDMFYSELAFSVTGLEELGSTSCAKMSTFLLGPQLTSYGFSVLHDDLKARQPTVLFWNEKLITVCKVQDQIYVLLNDLSLLSTETDVVWERLTEENGDGLFVDCDFVPRDSKVQSILPLTKNERKKRNRKEKRGLKKKEGGRNEDRDGEKTDDEEYEKTEEKDDEKTGEKDDGNIEDQPNISGLCGNLNISPIDFLGRSTHIIHQINDGPCALIAACNILLLKGRIFFEPHETAVSIEFLVNLVISLLNESVKMKVLRYIPGLLDGSNEKAEVGEHETRKFGLYTADADSLSIFPRQVNEHGKSKSKEDLELERQLGLEENVMICGNGWKRSWTITCDQKSLDVVEPGYSAVVFSEIMVVMVVERGTAAVVVPMVAVVPMVSDTVAVVSVVSDTVVMVMPVVSDAVVQVWFRTPVTFRAKAPSAAMKSESEAMVSRSTAALSTVMA
ncbi:hypothetical protein ACQ4PT_064776 [Festuca glaucescens]